MYSKASPVRIIHLAFLYLRDCHGKCLGLHPPKQSRQLDQRSQTGFAAHQRVHQVLLCHIPPDSCLQKGLMSGEIVMIKGQECDRCQPPKRRERKGRRTCVVRSDAEGNTYSCTSRMSMKRTHQTISSWRHHNPGQSMMPLGSSKSRLVPCVSTQTTMSLS